MRNGIAGARRLGEAFAKARDARSRAVIPYVTAGDPSLRATVDVTYALAEAGADIVEWGVPFSDPLADGVTIQRSTQRSLAAGTTCRGVLEAAATLRSEGCTVPLALLVYGNTLWRYGIGPFVRDAREAGVDGLIVPDIPIEEGDELVAATRDAGVAWVPLVAPTSPAQRIARVTGAGAGFVYCVSVTGVTGARDRMAEGLPAFLSRVRSHTAMPLAVGFGVSGPDQARAIVREAGADGVIVGSALVQTLEKAAPADRPEAAKRFISRIKEAVSEENEV